MQTTCMSVDLGQEPISSPKQNGAYEGAVLVQVERWQASSIGPELAVLVAVHPKQFNDTL